MNKMEEKVSVGKLIAGFSLLIIICIVAFLIAKYIVRNNIGWENPPVDVSERY